MITAPPPDYCQEMSMDEARLRPRGFSEDARCMEQASINAIRHLCSTPGRFVSVGNDDDYEVPTPQAVTTKKVRFRYLGAGRPLPLDKGADGS